ncbi:MAG: DUF4097 family beta strand repeat protein [Bacteroidetes bacterium]|nr:DUF4097 family beta strand repeat protein [Bacteroidota bacterium]
MRQSCIFLALLIFAGVSGVSAQASRELNKTVALRPDGRLTIDNYKGSITITSHDKPQVDIYVKIESDDPDTWDAERDIENTQIKIDGGEDGVTIRTDYKKVKRHHFRNFWDWITDPFESSYTLPFVHYTIAMPATADLRIKDYKSEIRISDMKTDLILNTYKGQVEIKNLIGSIDLETYKGDVRVSFGGINKDSRFETYKGKILIGIPKDSGFELRTDFERRVDFASDFDVSAVERGRKHRYSDYRGKINGGGPMLELQSKKGNIRLKEE